MENKMTAVDLFMAYVSKHKEFLGYDLDEVYKQDKAIEKDQIVKAFNDGYDNGYVDSGKEAEQYYNETYKK